MSRPAVLAACTTAIGDTLLSTPALAALAGSFDLDVLVHQMRRPLLEDNPHIRRLYTYRSNLLFRLALAMTAGRRHYHRLLIMHANPSFLPLIKYLDFEQSGNIQGYQDEALDLVDVAVDHEAHTIDQRLALAQWAGAEPTPGPMRIYLSFEETWQAVRWLSSCDLDVERPMVAMCLGTAQPQKFWPAERFGRVARALMDDGAQVLVVGSRHESRLFRRAEEAAGSPLIPVLGMDLRFSAALLSQMDLLVTCDTGPMHMAVAMDTPVLAIFGPTSPELFGPRGDCHRVLRLPLTCHPCLERGCPDPERPECLRALEPETVIDEARAMLAARKKSRDDR